MDHIKILIAKPECTKELTRRYTDILAKVLSNKLPYSSIDIFVDMIETKYADEISASECNTMKGEKNEYGCDLHEEV